MDITNFNNITDAIHYINNRAIEDKYTNDNVCVSIELVNKKTKKIVTAYVLDSEYFDLDFDGQIFEESDPRLKQIINRTLQNYEDEEFY